MDATTFVGKAGFLLVVNGYLKIDVNGVRHHLFPGDALIVSPLFFFNNIEESKGLNCERVLVGINVFLEKIRKIFDPSFVPFIYENPVVHLVQPQLGLLAQSIKAYQEAQKKAEDPKLPKNIQRVMALSAQLGYQSVIADFLAELFHANRDKLEGNAAKKDNNIIVLTNFLLQLNQQFASHRSVTYYASLCNLSTGRFSAIVRETTGHSPMHWITTVTINNAKIMLRQSNGKTIKTIAQELGFPEQYTFRKYFKEHAGVSPSEYKSS